MCVCDGSHVCVVWCVVCVCVRGHMCVWCVCGVCVL